jgi:hypothetical protein
MKGNGLREVLPAGVSTLPGRRKSQKSTVSCSWESTAMARRHVAKLAISRRSCKCRFTASRKSEGTVSPLPLATLLRGESTRTRSTAFTAGKGLFRIESLYPFQRHAASPSAGSRKQSGYRKGSDCVQDTNIVSTAQQPAITGVQQPLTARDLAVRRAPPSGGRVPFAPASSSPNPGPLCAALRCACRSDARPNSRLF